MEEYILVKLGTIFLGLIISLSLSAALPVVNICDQKLSATGVSFQDSDLAIVSDVYKQLIDKLQILIPDDFIHVLEEMKVSSNPFMIDPKYLFRSDLKAVEENIKKFSFLVEQMGDKKNQFNQIALSYIHEKLQGLNQQKIAIEEMIDETKIFSGEVFNNHNSKITSIAAQKDFIISTSVDGKLFIWNLKNGSMKNITLHQADDAIISTTVSSDEEELITGNLNSTIEVISLSKLEVIRRFELAPLIRKTPKVLFGLLGGGEKISFPQIAKKIFLTPDKKRIYALVADTNSSGANTVYSIENVDGAIPQKLADLDYLVDKMLISNDKKHIITYGSQKFFLYLNPITKKFKKIDCGGWISKMNISQDSSKLVIAMAAREIKILDLNNNFEVLKTIPPTVWNVIYETTNILFINNDSAIATFTYNFENGQIEIRGIDIASNKTIFNYNFESKIHMAPQINFNKDFTYLTIQPRKFSKIYTIHYLELNQ